MKKARHVLTKQLHGFPWSIVDLINTSNPLCTEEGNHWNQSFLPRSCCECRHFDSVAMFCCLLMCTVLHQSRNGPPVPVNELTDLLTSVFKRWLVPSCMHHWELNSGRLVKLFCHVSWNWDASLQLFGSFFGLGINFKILPSITVRLCLNRLAPTVSLWSIALLKNLYLDTYCFL